MSGRGASFSGGGGAEGGGLSRGRRGGKVKKKKKNQNEPKKVKLVTEWSLEFHTSELSFCPDRVKFELSRLKRLLVSARGTVRTVWVWL